MQQQACLPVLVLLLLLCCNQQLAEGSVTWCHAVVIDAGSTGSRAHVFRYHMPAASGDSGSHLLSGYPMVELPESVLKTSPGLSSYAGDPAAAGASLQPLIRFAKSKVPAAQWPHTPIQLMATAGVRMLRNGSAERIMAEVGKSLSASGFAFSGARVLSGSEEGLLGWVALNYASGALQAASAQKQPNYLGRKDPPHPSSSSSSSKPPLVGVLELGGGSLQVTFLPSKPPPSAEAAPLALPSLGTGRLYSRSFDGMGLQAAMASWSSALSAQKKGHDPCLPSGFKAGPSSPSGSGDWGACKVGVAGLLPQERPCLYKLCGLAGSFLPPVEGTKFVGVDNIHYTASTLGLSASKTSSLNDLDKAAATFCGRSWSDIRAHELKHHRGDPAKAYHTRVCFSAALIISLLKEGLHLPPAAPLLNPSNSITTPQGKTLEAKWPLGALVVGLLQTGGSGLTAAGPLSPTPSGPIGKTLALTPKRDKTHDHPMLGSGEDTGLSAGSAAAVAAMFCMALLAATLCLSWLGVGLPGNGRCGVLCQRLWKGVSRKGGVGAVGASGGGGVTGSSAGSNGSHGSSVVRYMRVRPSSRTDTTFSPRSRSASPASGSRRDEGVGGVGGGSIMLTVLPGGAEWSAADWDSSASSSPANGVGGGGGGSSVGVAKGGRPLTARQR